MFWQKQCPLRDSQPPGDLIYTHAIHSIYEVDGAEHQLFAQNLSLFAKLFLDNKSVFFDVASFNYYLLVARIPTCAVQSPIGASTTTQSESEEQIIGFFSKEKLSWDNNNLACILVFPPWQRKGLGRILMGISYELSRREGRYGGPEKPLSELGKRGYRQFWMGRVAREVLGPPAPLPASTASTMKNATRGGRGRGRGRGSITNPATARTRPHDANKAGAGCGGGGIRKKSSISLGELARRCWLLPEDCITALWAMGIGVSEFTPQASVTMTATTEAPADHKEKEQESAKKKRKRKDGKVVIDKALVRSWVARSRADLRATVDGDGFCDQWEEGASASDGQQDEGDDGHGVQSNDDDDDDMGDDDD